MVAAIKEAGNTPSDWLNLIHNVDNKVNVRPILRSL